MECSRPWEGHGLVGRAVMDLEGRPVRRRARDEGVGVGKLVCWFMRGWRRRLGALGPLGLVWLVSSLGLGKCVRGGGRAYSSSGKGLGMGVYGGRLGRMEGVGKLGVRMRVRIAFDSRTHGFETDITIGNSTITTSDKNAEWTARHAELLYHPESRTQVEDPFLYCSILSSSSLTCVQTSKPSLTYSGDQKVQSLSSSLSLFQYENPIYMTATFKNPRKGRHTWGSGCGSWE